MCIVVFRAVVVFRVVVFHVGRVVPSDLLSCVSLVSRRLFLCCSEGGQGYCCQEKYLITSVIMTVGEEMHKSRLFPLSCQAFKSYLKDRG